jgi:hypothetical protein
MDQEKRRELMGEAIDFLEEGYEEIHLETKKGERFCIATSGSYLGGEGSDTWISEVLGNIAYNSIERVVVDTFDYIEGSMEDEVEYIEF